VLQDSGTETPLHANQWAGGRYAPHGQRSIESFHLEETLPVWRFAVEDLRVEQRIWMDHGRNQARVGFRWIQGERDLPPLLRIGLLASLRDHHAVDSLQGFHLERESLTDGYGLHLPGGRFVDVRGATGRFSPDETWIENFYLVRERERGLEDIDHHLRIGRVEIPLEPETWVGIGVGLDGPEGNDASVRPNQLFAVSRPYSPLGDAAARREVVDTGRERPLTPFGLRSLAADDPRYCGRYLGGPTERGGCNHQGPVWGWLLGHYDALAEHRVTSDKPQALFRLESIPAHLSQAGLGHISEIFDGDPPHGPRGTPAQAWSASCALDAWWRLAGQLLTNGWQE
jgi:hypothetical protein